MRGTTRKSPKSKQSSQISIHVPLAGDDSAASAAVSLPRAISIHVPLAGDDVWRARCNLVPKHFYPRPPCGGRHNVNRLCRKRCTFLSTSPLRGTTSRRCRTGHTPAQISIHVPLAGDDGSDYRIAEAYTHFYPRPPCGGRPKVVVPQNVKAAFLSTSPLRGTTPVAAVGLALCNISIHVPLAGDDRGAPPQRRTRRNFYPRPPCGGRRMIF